MFDPYIFPRLPSCLKMLLTSHILFLLSDIDECTTNTHACVHSSCTNTDGGYTCSCDTGYQPKQGSVYICEGKLSQILKCYLQQDVVESEIENEIKKNRDE